MLGIMKIRNFRCVAVAALLMTAVGCDELANWGILDGLKDLELDVDRMEFDAEGGEAGVMVESLFAWEATCSDSWLSVSPEFGEATDKPVEIKVTVEKNTGEAREALVTITADKLRKEVKVIQNAAGNNGDAMTVTVGDLAGLEDNTRVTVTGNVVASYARGFVLSDGKANVLVYEGPGASGQEVGASVEVTATKITYRGAIELNSVEHVSVKGQEEITYPEPIVCTCDNVEEIKAMPTVYCQFTGTFNYYDEHLLVDIEGTEIDALAHYPLKDMYASLYQYRDTKVKISGYYTWYYEYPDGQKVLTFITTGCEPLEGSSDDVVKEVSIPEVLVLEKDTQVKVKGHIVARYTHGFLLSDGTNLILVYEADNASGYPVGSKVTVHALTDVYAEQIQLSRVVSVEATGSQTVTHPTPTVYTASNLSELMTRERPSYIQFTGTLSISTLTTSSGSGPFYKFKVDGSEQELTIHYPLPELEDKVKGQDGKIFKITAYHIGVRTLTSGSTQTTYKCINTMAVEVELVGSAEPDVTGQGTLESPYSPAEANKLIMEGKHDPDAEVYVEGIISQIKEVSTQYGNATYYISADGSTTDQFYVYRGKYLNGEAFTATDQIQLGDKVVVLGKLMLYNNSIAEMETGSRIVSHVAGSGGNGGGGNNGGGEPGYDVPTGWLELPVMDPSSGLEYYSHHFTMNGRKYRNYSFGWSQKDLVALWVAYPLCSMHTKKNVNRSDAWAYDPALGSSKSPAPFGGYGGDYSRGHQVPSADRLCCLEANQHTFYGTNMTPQLNAHNSGIWENLETRVRTIANASDTTYVVTGCVVDGSKEKTVDSDGKSITVPVAYWKAVLRYEASSTANKWACAAFYTEHRAYSGTNLKSLSMSVDELEKLVGIDFFANLPAKVGAAEADRLEAQDPAGNSIWW